MRLVPISFVALFSACEVEPQEPDIEDLEIADLDADADTDGELYVRKAGTSIWMSRELERRDSKTGAAVFVLRGRVSRNLTGGLGFVADDPYGEFAIQGARRFEVTWPVSTARSLVDGVDQFVRTSFVPSSDRPEHLTSRVVIRPRLAELSGSSRIDLTTELVPIVVDGVLVYRGSGSSTCEIAGVAMDASGVVIAGRATDTTHFEYDLDPEAVLAIAETGATVSIRVVLANGSVVAKVASLGLSIKRFGITPVA